MKRLLIVLVVVEVLLAAMLIVPLLHERASYRSARAAQRMDPSDEMREAWQAEQARRDRQVMLAFAAVVGLCLNSCVLCFVFGRVVGDQERPRTRRGVLSPAGRRRKRLAQLALLVAFGLIAVGSTAFAGALRDPSKAGLRGLVAVLVGGLLAFGAILAWALAASPDAPPPVAGEGDEGTTGP